MTLAASVMSRAATGGRDDWETPPNVLERVRKVGPIDLDPCTTDDNPIGAGAWICPPSGDGLIGNWSLWSGGGLTFVNPPYSAMSRWASKIATEAVTGPCEIVSLVAARPDTGWFRLLVWQTAQAVCFWNGRLRFVGAPASAPFPSAVVYHGKRPWLFESAFHDVGRVVRL